MKLKRTHRRTHINKHTHTHTNIRMLADILRNVTCQPAAKYNCLRASCRCLRVCVYVCLCPYLACYEKCIQCRLDRRGGECVASRLPRLCLLGTSRTTAAVGGARGSVSEWVRGRAVSLSLSNEKSCEDKWLSWLSLRNQSENTRNGTMNHFSRWFSIARADFSICQLCKLLI